MTQPIQEPVTQRAISQLNWGQNQLFRRPDPNAASTVSVFRAYRTTTLSIGGAGTGVAFRWNIWENCDEDVFDFTEVGGLLDTVSLLVPGHIIIYWGVQFADALAGSMGMFIQDDDPVFGPLQHMVIHGETTDGVRTFQLADSLYTQTLSKSYPTLDIFSSGSQFPMQFNFQAAQISGSAVNITFAILDIQYQPADVCTGPIES